MQQYLSNIYANNILKNILEGFIGYTIRNLKKTECSTSIVTSLKGHSASKNDGDKVTGDYDGQLGSAFMQKWGILK